MSQSLLVPSRETCRGAYLDLDLDHEPASSHGNETVVLAAKLALREARSHHHVPRAIEALIVGVMRMT